MSAPIDVLAVMDLHAKGFRHLGYPSAADELFKARAAVAELIGAAAAIELEVRTYGPARPYSSDSFLPEKFRTPLVKALSRVGGDV